MKPILLPTILALSFVCLGLAQDPPEEGTEERLVERVEVLEGELATLKEEAAAQKALTEEALRYLAGAKQRSEALLKVFDESEKAGFTAGINFTSREILLAGLRAYVRDEAANLPASKKVEEKKAPASRR